MILLSSRLDLFAQPVDSLGTRVSGTEHHDELTLLAAYQQGHSGFVELGVGRNRYGSNRHPYDLAYYGGIEARLDRPDLLGVKLGAYVDGGFAMGVQVIEYFHGSERSTVLRPEVGIGFFKFKLTYAYNAVLTEPRMDGINAHMIGVSHAFRLRGLRGDDDWKGGSE